MFNPAPRRAALPDPPCPTESQPPLPAASIRSTLLRRCRSAVPGPHLLDPPRLTPVAVLSLVCICWIHPAVPPVHQLNVRIHTYRSAVPGPHQLDPPRLPRREAPLGGGVHCGAAGCHPRLGRQGGASPLRGAGAPRWLRAAVQVGRAGRRTGCGVRWGHVACHNLGTG